MESFKILVTGATGYIGGSVLSTLLETGVHKKHLISVLVRGEEKAKALQTQGVTTVLFNDLDDSALLQRIASEHDIVIHTASGFHTASARALILGLGERKKETGNKVHYIHTSGTSNMGDQPITGKYHEVNNFTDKSNIYAYQKYRESLQIYPQRTTDLVTVETGLQVGVPTTIVMSPTIYGVGSGTFNTISIQVSTIMRSAIKSGQVIMIGEGKGVWDYVHIADLARLYELLILKAIAGEQLPTGEAGILFSAAGRYSWRELSESIAKSLLTVGAITTDVVRSVDLEDAAEKYQKPNLLYTELGFSSNSRTSSDLSRELGWKPQKTEQDFKNHFLEEAKLVAAENKSL